MTRHAVRRRGFTLVEVLIAVAITSALLIATATAIAACTRAYGGNVASADRLQHGRNAVMRMAAELRAGTDHLPLTPGKQTTFAAGVTVTDTGVVFHDDAGRTITYSYDATAKTLTLKVDSGAASVLARGVDAFAARLVPARSPASVKTGGLYDELGRATITLTLHSVDAEADAGTGTLTLTQSVTPRARLWD